VQPPARHSPVDPAAINTDCEQLRPRHDAVLPARDLGEPLIGWGCPCTHTVH
jgi:hypothetical protein